MVSSISTIFRGLFERTFRGLLLETNGFVFLLVFKDGLIESIELLSEPDLEKNKGYFLQNSNFILNFVIF